MIPVTGCSLASVPKLVSTADYRPIGSVWSRDSCTGRAGGCYFKTKWSIRPGKTVSPSRESRLTVHEPEIRLPHRPERIFQTQQLNFCWCCDEVDALLYRITNIRYLRPPADRNVSGAVGFAFCTVAPASSQLQVTPNSLGHLGSDGTILARIAACRLNRSPDHLFGCCGARKVRLLPRSRPNTERAAATGPLPPYSLFHACHQS